MKALRRYGPFVLALLCILGVGVLLLWVGPKQIVESIGVNNTYLALFLFAIFGGVSTFSSGAFYTSIAIFTGAGLDPITIALISGVGLTLGDAVFFYLGVQARDAFLDRYEKKIHKISSWLQKRRALIPAFAYLYTGFSPFPGDLLMITLSILDYPFKKAVLPVFLGNTTLAFLLAQFGDKILPALGY